MHIQATLGLNHGRSFQHIPPRLVSGLGTGLATGHEQQHHQRRLAHQMEGLFRVHATRSGMTTPFPTNGNQPTIPDVTWARNNAHTMTRRLSNDIDGAGDSHQTLITTLLSIKPPDFTRRREYHQASWDLFHFQMRKLQLGESDFLTKESTQATATRLDLELQEAADIAIPGPNLGPKQNHGGHQKYPSSKFDWLQHTERRERSETARCELGKPYEQKNLAQDHLSGAVAILGKHVPSRDQSSGARGNKLADKKKAVSVVPNIQGISIFQGMCKMLEDLFFHANVDLPPAMPEGFLKPPTWDSVTGRS